MRDLKDAKTDFIWLGIYFHKICKLNLKIYDEIYTKSDLEYSKIKYLKSSLKSLSHTKF